MGKIVNGFAPLVSIVIPIYNGEKYMREAIDSALSQTYKNIEVVVVNDGSTDDTERIAKSYGNKIRYFSKENGGVATALNLAIKKSKGEYISWLSHDDVYYKEKIKKQIEAIGKIRKSVRENTIVFSNYSIIDTSSNITRVMEFHKEHGLNQFSKSLFALSRGLVHGCTLLIPKNLFEEVGYFNHNLRTTQDYDLWFRMFPGRKIIFLEEPLVKSRWHGDQGSKKIKTASAEANELWKRFVDTLSDEQKIAIDDTPSNFYKNSRDFMKKAGFKEAENHIRRVQKRISRRDLSDIKVSIIIPFFNRIDWTMEAINSAISQTHKNIEVIVVDDNSTDDVEPINRLRSKDKRIVMVGNKRKKGVSGARNTGLDLAKGEYIAFLDSDDLFAPNKIAQQLEFMVRKGHDFTHTSYKLFGGKATESRLVNAGASDYKFPDVITYCGIATPTVMINKALINNKDQRFLEDFTVGEDTCFWISLTKKVKCVGLNRNLTQVREHDERAALTQSKMIDGLGNILHFLINNHLNKETYKYINFLNLEYVRIGGHTLSEEINQKIFGSTVLQVSDNDIVGNKFNGHDLHIYLNNKGMIANQLVWSVESQDSRTYQIARARNNRGVIYSRTLSLLEQYSLNGVLNPISYDILRDPLFLYSEVSHLHLIHNNIFDVLLLPILSRLKPLIWTVHDPWAVGGHCIHHFDCKKWETGCGDCLYLSRPFALKEDNSALTFMIKSESIKNSNVNIIVASEWMRGVLRKSPAFRDKKIHLIPFGVNQDIFRPIDKNFAKKELGIPEDSFVISFRCDYSGFKGMEYIEHVLENLKLKKPIVILVLKDKLKKEYKNIRAYEYGWVNDDSLLAKIYAASELFLMPSEVESFGMMAVEAMSCGTLPIVLDGTALPDTVNAPSVGVSVARDKDSFLKAVQFYSENNRERNKRATLCLGYAKQNYNKEDYLSKIIKVYRDAVKGFSQEEKYERLLHQMKKNLPIKLDNYLSNSCTAGKEKHFFYKNWLKKIIRFFCWLAYPLVKKLKTVNALKIYVKKIEKIALLHKNPDNF